MSDYDLNDYIIMPICITSDIQAEMEITNKISLLPLCTNIKKEMLSYYEDMNYRSDLSEADFCIRLKIDSNNNYPSIAYYDYIGNLSNLLSISIRLLKLGSSGCMGHFKYPFKSISSGGMQSLCLLSNKINYDLGRTEINSSELNNFSNLYNKIINLSDENNKINDEHFDLMIRKYLYATSGIRTMNLSNRFIDLMTIIEMLYSPKQEVELSFRVSLAFAKLFSKYDLKIDEDKHTETTKEKFDEMRNLYTIRSSLVHGGKSKYLYRFIVQVGRRKFTGVQQCA